MANRLTETESHLTEAARATTIAEMTPFPKASPALVASLIYDPFYCALTDDFGTNSVARKRALSCYFEFSLGEAQRTDRCVVAPDPTLGAAAWLLLRTPDVDAASPTEGQRNLSLLGRPRRSDQLQHRSTLKGEFQCK